MPTVENILLDEYQGNDSLLYHYTSIESACKILKSNKLRLSNLTTMNDPLEFCEPDNFSFIGKCENISKVIDELRLSLQERENFVRLFCFCKDEFCNQEEWQNQKAQHKASNLLHKGWARNRMWAQYADNHKGVCLVFNKAEFKTKFMEMKVQVPQRKILEDREITYTNYLHEFKATMTDEINAKNHGDNFSHYFLDDKRLKYLFFKCEDYRDENEYRFVLIDNQLKSATEELFVDIGTSLKAIILGQRFSNLIRLVPPIDVEQYRIQWNCGFPELIRQ